MAAQRKEPPPPRKAWVPSYMNCLRKLHGDMSILLANGDYSDLKISCKGIDFKVHRAILFPRCKFFAACGQFKEGEDGVIVLNDDDPKALHMVLEEIYTRNNHTVQNHFANDNGAGFALIVETWKLADKYQLPELTQQCLTYICSEDGINLLTERAGDKWTHDLLTALITSDGLGVDDEGARWNKEMREKIKQLLLSSKKISQLSESERQLLATDQGLCVELLMCVSEEQETAQTQDIPAVNGESSIGKKVV